MPKASLYPIGVATGNFQLLGVDSAGRLRRFEKADLAVVWGAPAGTPPVTPPVVTPPGTTQVAPSNLSLPVISPGTVQVGVALSGDNGSFTGSPTPVITVQWERDDIGDISNAILGSYTPVVNDINHRLRKRVKADNGVGQPSIVYSAWTSLVISAVTTAPPSVQISPSVSGLAVDGGVLTLDYGVFGGSPAPVPTQQWVYGDNGAAIPNATQKTLTVSAARDAGHTVKALVNYGNGIGNPLVIPTAPTGVVLGLKPRFTANPQIVPGDGAVGDTRTTTLGTVVSADPVTYEIRWMRPDLGTDVPDEEDGDKQTRTYVAADGGHFTQTRIVAINKWGRSDPAYSSWSGLIAGASTPPASLPTEVTPPSISGSLIVGGTITGTPGVYNG